MADSLLARLISGRTGQRPPPVPTPAQVATQRSANEALAEQIEALLEPYRVAHQLDTIAQAAADLLSQVRIQREAQAKERAQALLLAHLSDAQKEEWKRYNEITVQGQTMSYWVGPVSTWVSDGPNTGTYLCVTPRKPGLPAADVVLGLKLMIEGSEGQFLKTANPNSYSGVHLRPDGTIVSSPGRSRLIPQADVYRGMFLSRRRLRERGIPETTRGTLNWWETYMPNIARGGYITPFNGMAHQLQIQRDLDRLREREEEAIRD